MKRLISTCTLLILLFAACDSPLGDVDTGSNHAPSAQPGQAPPAVLSNIPAAKMDSVRKIVFRQFQARHGSKWKVSWSKKKATPLAVFAGMTKPVHGSPEQAARAFLTQNRSLLICIKDLAI